VPRRSWGALFACRYIAGWTWRAAEIGGVGKVRVVLGQREPRVDASVAYWD
jgi:hypothetical protein